MPLQLTPALIDTESYLFVGRLQNMLPYSKTQSSTSVSEGFEVLGLKWLPSLNSQQARQLTPFEVGDKDWKSSVHALTSGKCTCIYIW